MSDSHDGIPKPLPADMLTGPAGDFPLVNHHVASAVTLELHGDPTIAQAALGIARSKIGRHETEAKNWGPFIREVAAPFISPARLVSYGPTGIRAGKLAWCAFFACWCVLKALQAAGARADHIAIWMRLASGSCTTLLERLTKLGLATRHRPGDPVPEGTYFVFYGADTTDGPEMSHVGIYSHTVGMLLEDVSGNAGAHIDAVAEGKHMLTDERIHSTARLPF